MDTRTPRRPRIRWAAIQVTAYSLLGLNGWMWLVNRPDGWMW